MMMMMTIIILLIYVDMHKDKYHKSEILSLTLFYCVLANEPSCIENGRHIKSLVTLRWSLTLIISIRGK